MLSNYRYVTITHLCEKRIYPFMICAYSKKYKNNKNKLGTSFFFYEKDLIEKVKFKTFEKLDFFLSQSRFKACDFYFLNTKNNYIYKYINC
tara:strand:- start:156 stop:428 length:273 start_codon:yes stop_codon:yes gene_type:complete